MYTESIRMREQFNSALLHSRDNARHLVAKLPVNTLQISLDFDGVELVNRSFATQLFFELSKKAWQIEMHNVNPEVSQMLRIAENSLTNSAASFKIHELAAA